MADDYQKLLDAEQSTPMPDWSRVDGAFGRRGGSPSVTPSLRPYVDVKLENRRGKKAVRGVIGVKGTF